MSELDNYLSGKYSKDYKEKIRFLRTIRNDIDYDLRGKIHPSTKRRVDRLLKEWHSLQNRPGVKAYRPSPSNKKALFNLAQQDDPNWKYALVPQTSPDQKIKFEGYGKKKTAILESKYIKEEVFYFNKKNLVKNPKREIHRLLKGQSYNKIFIVCGAFNYYNPLGTIEEAEEIVIEFMNLYSNSGEWLDGIKIVHFKNQEGKEQYLDSTIKRIINKEKRRKPKRKRK